MDERRNWRAKTLLKEQEPNKDWQDLRLRRHDFESYHDNDETVIKHDTDGAESGYTEFHRRYENYDRNTPKSGEFYEGQQYKKSRKRFVII